MRWNHFAGSLGFALLAAAVYPLYALLVGPILGIALALSLYVLAAAVVYGVGLAPPRHRAVALAAACVLAAGVALLASRPQEVLAGAALIVGICRSGLRPGAAPLRALTVETLLLGGGLLLARGVGGGGLLASALGLWAFGLVQSCFFLIGGSRAPGRAPEGIDPFDLARDRLLALLHSEPGGPR